MHLEDILTLDVNEMLTPETQTATTCQSSTNMVEADDDLFSQPFTSVNVNLPYIFTIEKITFRSCHQVDTCGNDDSDGY